MAKQARFWSVDNRLAEISAGGDPMETLNATVDFERLRPPEGSDGADHPDHRYGRANAAITMANMVYNTDRLRWLLSQGAPI